MKEVRSESGQSQVRVRSVINIYLAAQNKENYPVSPHHVASLSNSSNNTALDLQRNLFYYRMDWSV